MKKKRKGGSKPVSKSKPASTSKRVSALDAAARVLATAGRSMSARELVTVMAEQGLWKSPTGKTPHATLYAAMMREINGRPRPRFTRDGRGTFSLAGGTEAAAKGA